MTLPVQPASDNPQHKKLQESRNKLAQEMEREVQRIRNFIIHGTSKTKQKDPTAAPLPPGTTPHA